MYAALFEIDSWLGCQQYIFEGNSPDDLLVQFEEVQDLSCLVRMGRVGEGKKGQKEIDKLEAFLDKYYSGNFTIEDLKTFNVNISVGAMACIAVAEGDEEISRLKQAYPNAK